MRRGNPTPSLLTPTSQLTPPLRLPFLHHLLHIPRTNTTQPLRQKVPTHQCEPIIPHELGEIKWRPRSLINQVRLGFIAVGLAVDEEDVAVLVRGEGREGHVGDGGFAVFAGRGCDDRAPDAVGVGIVF